MSPSAFISNGKAICDWQRWAIVPNFGPFPTQIDEVEIEEDVIESWPNWVAELVPVGSKWERLHWPDGSFTVRLVDGRLLVSAAIHFETKES